MTVTVTVPVGPPSSLAAQHGEPVTCVGPVARLPGGQPSSESSVLLMIPRPGRTPWQSLSMSAALSSSLVRTEQHSEDPFLSLPAVTGTVSHCGHTCSSPVAGFSVSLPDFSHACHFGCAANSKAVRCQVVRRPQCKRSHCYTTNHINAVSALF